MEAIPLRSMTAVDCARALVECWIVRYGVPSDVVSDQGRQFMSSLWAELLRLCGITSARTTAYHPQANGMVERLHRTLKERLMARGAGIEWMDHLPAVLLGLRAAVREDAGVSPAELVFGALLRLPGGFFGDDISLVEDAGEVPPPAFVDQLRRSFAACGPAPVVHHSSGVSRSLPSSLLRADYVYIRVDAVRAPLVPPYEGPSRVLEAGLKTFLVDRAGKSIVVSVDRLKPALGCLRDPAPPVVPSAPLVRNGVVERRRCVWGKEEKKEEKSVISGQEQHKKKRKKKKQHSKSSGGCATGPLPASSVSQYGRVRRPPVHFLA